MDHYGVANADAGDISSYRCVCGGSYNSYQELEYHLSHLGAGDKRTVNPVFAKLVGISPEVFENAKFPPRSFLNVAPLDEEIRTFSKISEVKHSWKNFVVDESPYVCRCGEEFDEHEKLMKHTAELNPVMNPEDFGRAGAGIERQAHEETLESLNEAVGFLQYLVDDDSTHYEIAEEMKEFLIKIGRYNGTED